MADLNNKVGIEIGIEFNTKKLDSYLSKLKKTKIDLKVKLGIDAKSVKADIAKALPKITKIPTVLDIDRRQFDRDLREIGSNATIKVKVEFDSQQIKKDLKKAIASASASGSVTVESTTNINNSVNLNPLIAEQKKNTEAIKKQIQECCEHITTAVGDSGSLIGKILINNSRKKAASNLIGDLLGGVTNAITAPVKAVFRGAFEGFGQKLTGPLARSFSKSLVSTLGVDSEKIGQKFGAVAGARLRKELEKVFPKFIQEFSKAAQEKEPTASASKKGRPDATIAIQMNKAFAAIRMELGTFKQVLIATQTQTAALNDRVGAVTESFTSLRASVGLLDSSLRKVADKAGVATRKDTGKAPVNTNPTGKAGVIGGQPATITRKEVGDQVKKVVKSLKDINEAIIDEMGFKDRGKQLAKLLERVRKTRDKLRADSKNTDYSESVRRSLAAYNKTNSEIDRLEKQITSRLKLATEQGKSQRFKDIRNREKNKGQTSPFPQNPLPNEGEDEGTGTRLFTTGKGSGKSIEKIYIDRITQVMKIATEGIEKESDEDRAMIESFIETQAAENLKAQQVAVKNFYDIWDATLTKSGLDPSALKDKMPRVEEDETLASGGGNFQPVKNKIALSSAAITALGSRDFASISTDERGDSSASMEVIRKTIDTIAHELRHALQSAFGAESFSQAVEGKGMFALSTSRSAADLEGADRSTLSHMEAARNFGSNSKQAFASAAEQIADSLSVEVDAYKFGREASETFAGGGGKDDRLFSTGGQSFAPKESLVDMLNEDVNFYQEQLIKNATETLQEIAEERKDVPGFDLDETSKKLTARVGELLQEEIERLKARTITAVKNVQDIWDATLVGSDVDPDMARFAPSLRRDQSLTGGEALYDKDENRVDLSPEVLDTLSSQDFKSIIDRQMPGAIDEIHAAIEVLSHELRHALQLNFGSISVKDAVEIEDFSLVKMRKEGSERDLIGAEKSVAVTKENVRKRVEKGVSDEELKALNEAVANHFTIEVDAYRFGRESREKFAAGSPDDDRLFATGRRGIIGKAKGALQGARENVSEGLAKKIGEEIATKIARALFKLLSGKEGEFKTPASEKFKEFKKGGKASFIDEINRTMRDLINVIETNTSELHEVFQGAIATIRGISTKKKGLFTTGDKDPVVQRFSALFDQVSAKSGFDPEKLRSFMPQLTTNLGLSSGQGAFLGSENKIEISPEAMRGLQTGDIADEDIKAIIHEIRHAFQTAFGELGLKDIGERGSAAIPLMQGQTAQGMASTVAFAQQRMEQGRGVSKQELGVVSALENDADLFASQFVEEISASLASLNIGQAAQEAISAVSELIVHARSVVIQGMGANALMTTGEGSDEAKGKKEEDDELKEVIGKLGEVVRDTEEARENATREVIEGEILDDEPTSGRKSEKETDFKRRVREVNEKFGVSDEAQEAARERMSEDLTDTMDFVIGHLIGFGETIRDFVREQNESNFGGDRGAPEDPGDSPFIQEMVAQNRRNMGDPRGGESGNRDNLEDNDFMNMNILRDLSEDTRQIVAEGTGFAAAAAFANFPMETMQGLLLPLTVAFAPFVASINLATNALKPFVGVVSETLKALIPISTRFQAIGGTKEKGAKLQQFAQETALDLRIDIETAEDQFSKFVAAAKGTKLEGEGIKELFEAVSVSIKALGLNTEDAFLVMQGFLQIVSKNRITMEELRLQIAERFPSAMGVFQRAMGAATMGEFFEMVEGGISGDVGLMKVTDQLTTEFGEAGREAANNYISALTRISNTQKVFVRTISRGLEAPFTFVANKIADVLGLFTNNVEKVFATITTLLAGIFAQILAGGIFVTSVAKVINGMTLIEAALVGLTPIFANLYAILIPFGLGLFGDLVDDFATLITGIQTKGAFEQVFSAIENLISIVKMLVATIVKAAKTIINTAKEVWKTFSTTFKATTGVLGVFGGVFDAITTHLDVFRRLIAGAGQALSLFFAVIQINALARFLNKPLRIARIGLERFRRTMRKVTKEAGSFKSAWRTLTASMAKSELVAAAATAAFVSLIASSDFTTDYNKNLKSTISLVEDLTIAISRLGKAGSESGGDLKKGVEPFMKQQEGLKSKGVDLMFGFGNVFGFEEGFRTDDFIKAVNNAQAKMEEAVGAKPMAKATTIGQVQFNSSMIAASERNFALNQSIIDSDVFSGNFGETELGMAIETAKENTAELNRLMDLRSAMLKEDKNADVSNIDSQIIAVESKRKSILIEAEKFRSKFLKARKSIVDNMESIRTSEDMDQELKDKRMAIEQQGLDAIDSVLGQLKKQGVTDALDPFISLFETTKEKIKETADELKEFQSASAVAISQAKAAATVAFVEEGTDSTDLEKTLTGIEEEDVKQLIPQLQKSVKQAEEAIDLLNRLPVTQRADTFDDDFASALESFRDYQTQLASAETQLAELRISERKRVEQEILDVYKESLAKQLNANEIANEEFKQEILENQIAGNITDAEAAEESAKNAVMKTTQAIEEKRKELKKVIELRRNEEIQLLDESLDKERDIKAELSRLNTQLLQEELDAIAKESSAVADAIDREAQLRAKSVDFVSSQIEKQKSLISQYIAFIESEVKTLQSQIALDTSDRDVVSARLTTRNKKLEEAIALQNTLNDSSTSIEDRQKARDQLRGLGFGRGDTARKLQEEVERNNRKIAEEKKEALMAEENANARLLELEQKRQKAAAQTAVIEAKILELKAKQSLLESLDEKRKADASGDKAKIASANFGVQIAASQLDIAGQAVDQSINSSKILEEISQNEREKLANEQEKARIEFNSENEGILGRKDLLDTRGDRSQATSPGFIGMGNIPATLEAFQTMNLKAEPMREVNPESLLKSNSELIQSTNSLTNALSGVIKGEETGKPVTINVAGINITVGNTAIGDREQTIFDKAREGAFQGLVDALEDF